MRIGDEVFVPVNGGKMAHGQVVAIKGDIVIVSGDEERRRASEDGRVPIGVGFRADLVKTRNIAKKT